MTCMRHRSTIMHDVLSEINIMPHVATQMQQELSTCTAMVLSPCLRLWK